MNYKQLMTILNCNTDTQADTISIYVDGEYFPATLSWHENDVVAQYVLEIDDAYEIHPCENGVGEWEIYPTGETFDTRREAEARLKEIIDA